MMTEQQPRERAVPCQRCGVDSRSRQPRTMTWNLSALCDRHETQRKEDQ